MIENSNFPSNDEQTNQVSPARQQLHELLAQIKAEAEQEKWSEERCKLAVKAFANGGLSGLASSHALGLPSEAVPELAKEIRATSKRVKDGDLSDVERILSEQLVINHSMFLKASSVAAKTPSISHAIPAADAAIKFSRQTRQIAAAIADLKAPKRKQFTVIKNQNNLIAAVEELKAQLEESTDAALDIGSTPVTVPEDSPMEAVDELDRPPHN